MSFEVSSRSHPIPHRPSRLPPVASSGWDGGKLVDLRHANNQNFWLMPDELAWGTCSEKIGVSRGLGLGTRCSEAPASRLHCLVTTPHHRHVTKRRKMVVDLPLVPIMHKPIRSTSFRKLQLIQKFGNQVTGQRHDRCRLG